MSFSNLNYDEGTYRQSINQSIGPGMYKLKSPAVSCSDCYPYAPSVRLDKRGDSLSAKQVLIDVDSELMNITRRQTKDPRGKYLPNCPKAMCTSGEVCGQGLVGTCAQHGPGQRFGDHDLQHQKECFFAAEDTRLSNPSCNLRGTGWNRWDWVCLDPQAKLEMPFHWNISARLTIKDNHRPCIPNPIDQSPAFPLGGELPCEKTQSVCAPYQNPASVHWQTSACVRGY